jgi:hypothetical protein
MDYPKELLKDIYWAFSNGQYANQNEFETAIKTYHKEIVGGGLPVNLNTVLFESPKLVIQYDMYNEEEEDYDELQELLVAENGNNFTAGELLYKIHKHIGSKLEDDDNCYFEGLLFATIEDPDYPDIPVYFLITGT